jgi:hypothetical protein
VLLLGFLAFCIVCFDPASPPAGFVHLEEGEKAGDAGLEPENLLGLVNLGMVEFYSGHPDKGEELLKKAVRLRLELAPAWLTLGMIYMDRNEPDAALAASMGCRRRAVAAENAQRLALSEASGAASRLHRRCQCWRQRGRRRT